MCGVDMKDLKEQSFAVQVWRSVDSAVNDLDAVAASNAKARPTPLCVMLQVWDARVLSLRAVVSKLGTSSVLWLYSEAVITSGRNFTLFIRTKVSSFLIAT